MVVAQLVTRLLPKPEDAVSNPVTGILVTVSRKDENEFKEAGKGSVKTLLFI